MLFRQPSRSMQSSDPDLLTLWSIPARQLPWILFLDVHRSAEFRVFSVRNWPQDRPQAESGENGQRRSGPPHNKLGELNGSAEDVMLGAA